MQRKFIEYDLPLAEISEESAREKNIRHGHPSTLHIWWARRPLASSRATTFAALIDDPGPAQPEKRAEIRRLIQQITPWEAVKNGNSPAIQRAQEMIRQQYGDTPPKVLDPFAGGGSIPLEALRLGCETYASDYNPVAVFIEKATLEWPQKFGIEVELPRALVEDASRKTTDERRKTKNDALPNQPELWDTDDTVKVNLLAYLVEKWANVVLEEARAEIGRFYPHETSEDLVGKRAITEDAGWIPVGYLWARTIPCQNPTCGAEILLIKQFWLAKKNNKRIAYRPVVDVAAKQVDFELLAGDDLKRAQADGFDPSAGTVSRANAECLVCGQVTKAKQVRRLARDGEMGERMVAVVLHHPDEVGKKYRLATADDERVFQEAAAYLDEKLATWPYLETPLPEEKPDTRDHAVNRLPMYGMPRWKDIFNARQQLALVTFQEKIRGCYERLLAECEALAARGDGVPAAEGLAAAVVGYLAVVLDRQADYCTRLCTWHNTGEKLNHTFGRQALPMSWDYVELNPMNGSGGDWTSHLDWVLRYIENNGWHARAEAQAQRSSATDLPHADDSLNAIITDPPYYDNVPYAALSDFFYVWLKRTVGDQFAEMFSTPVVPKSDEAIMEPTRHDSNGAAKQFFEEMLGAAFVEMHRVLKHGGVAVVVYAHKTTEGWETMLNGLIEAGFVVTGSWPVHTEMQSRLRAAQSAALASSIYMVCRKMEREPVGFWNDIQPQVKARVEEKLAQFWAAGIAGGDFFISAIGPGMEAFSRYQRVETYDGQPVSVLDLLHYIRSVATDFLVHRLLKDASTEALDKAAQFYLTYRWTYLDNRVPYDDARKIASAEGVNLEHFWDDEGFVRKTTKYISVLGPKERLSAKADRIESVDLLARNAQASNMVDAMHQACLLWEKGDRPALNRFLTESGYGGSGAFWQFCQAVAECLLEGSKEKQLLEGLLLGKEQHQRAAAQAEQEAQIEMELG